MSEDPLSREAIAAVDVDAVLGEVLDLAEHLRDGLWRVESARLTATPTPGGIQVVGVDGLERGAHLAREALIPDLSGPIIVSGGTPTPEPLPTLVLLASYSGEDAAVLDAFEMTRRAQRVVLSTGGQLAEAARADGVPVIPLPGGFPEPRLALGYPLVVCLELARLGGLAQNSAAAVESAAAHVARLVRQWGPDSPSDSPAKRLAAAAVGRRSEDWAMSAVEVGETPLEKVATRLLLANLIDLYSSVLAAES